MFLFQKLHKNDGNEADDDASHRWFITSIRDQYQGSTPHTDDRGEDQCGNCRADAPESMFDIFVFAEVGEEFGNQDDDYDTWKNQTEGGNDSAKETKGFKSNISRHIQTNRTRSGFADCDHVSQFLIGKPCGLIAEFEQERNGCRTTAYSKESDFEKFPEYLQK